MSKRTPAKEAVFEFKRELILQAACEQFYTRGYGKTKLDDIADALKVTKPFIYYHYPSKLALLEEICRRTSAFAADLAEIAGAPSSRPLIERFAQFVHDFALRVIDERKVFSIYFRDSSHLPAATQARFRKDRRRFHAALSVLLLQGRQEGIFHFADLSITEQTLTGMITWLFNWYRDDGASTPHQIAEHMVTLVLATLGAATPNQACPSD